MGGPGDWPAWCMGYQPTAQAGRLRIVCGFHFEADELAEQAEGFTRIAMDVFRDARGRWCFAPKEEQPC